MKLRAVAMLWMGLLACAPAAPATEFFIQDHGKPISDAKLLVHPSNLESHDHENCATYTSGSDGKVRIPVLAAGSYDVMVYHPTYVFYQKSISIKGGAGERVECSLIEGGRVRGAVLDARGAAVADASVRAIDPQGLVEFSVAQTGADGSFAMTGLPLQSIRLYVHSGRHRPANFDGIDFKRPGESATARIELQDGKTLSGKVTYSDGQPAEGATVGCTDEGAPFVQTGPDGLFSVGGLGDAPVNLYAYKVGHAAHHVKAVAPGTSGLTLVLREAAVVRGEIAAASEMQVSLIKGNLKVAAAIVRPHQTKFEFTDLSADRYILSVEAARSAPFRMEISVAEGEARDLGLVHLPNPDIFEEGEKR